ncbi:hypothetical protein AVEN_137382-1 [Araneus ventricosus]|uniref:Uncharacterized protein n=1 Tax=Araneus ventricosus TaxID=182803 RepID=A0A4Y2E2H6_ARAVE|nr:hypothetical protein AVEN_137382-1 [Araneus ventricosus]
MDSSAPFPLFSSLRVVGDMNGRPFISHLSPKGPFNDNSPNCLLPLSKQQPAEIRLNSTEVASPVTAGSGVRVLSSFSKFVLLEIFRSTICNDSKVTSIFLSISSLSLNLISLKLFLFNLISPLRVSLKTTRPTAFAPFLNSNRPKSVSLVQKLHRRLRPVQESEC